MALKDGEFVKIEYSIWRASDGSLVRTTSRKLAEEKGIFNENARYEPQLVVIGKDGTIKGIHDLVRGMDVGQTKSAEFKPADAFGERFPELVHVMPISDFRKRDMEPVPGMQVDIDGAIATVKSVNSGRVMVDANHPFAGETLKCEVKVTEKIDQAADKVRSVFVFNNVKPDKVELKEKTAVIHLGSKIQKDARFFLDKSSAIEMTFRYLPEIASVSVEETYTREQPQEEIK